MLPGNPAIPQPKSTTELLQRRWHSGKIQTGNIELSRHLIHIRQQGHFFTLGYLYRLIRRRHLRSVAEFEMRAAFACTWKVSESFRMGSPETIGSPWTPTIRAAQA